MIDDFKNNGALKNSGDLISIILPLHNVGKYVLETLDSISKQSHYNFEAILIDDCSSDDTYELIANYASKDKRFKVLKNEINLQIAETLNHGLKYASGSYIARCDGDDVMEFDRLEQQLRWLNQYPKISLVGCSFVTIDESGCLLRKFKFPSGPDLLVKLLPYCTPVPHIWLARRIVYDVVGPYRMQTVEDYDFLLRANSAGFYFDNISEYYGMRVRVRYGNTVSTFGIAQRRLFNYAKAVNISKKNIFNESVVQHIINSREIGLLAWLHRRSDWLSQRASSSRKAWARITMHLLSAIISPLKMQYYLNSLIRIIIIFNSVKK